MFFQLYVHLFPCKCFIALYFLDLSRTQRIAGLVKFISKVKAVVLPHVNVNNLGCMFIEYNSNMCSYVRMIHGVLLLFVYSIWVYICTHLMSFFVTNRDQNLILLYKL